VGLRHLSAYSAAKHGVIGVVKGLACDLAGTGVTATALCPGPVRTGFAAAAGLDEQALDETLPAFFWVSAADVAKAGIKAMDEDRAVVIPGVANRVTAGAGWLTPRSIVVPMMKKFHPVFKPK
jgi:short-subunit dehydrogenase